MTADASSRRPRLDEALKAVRLFLADGFALFGFILLFALYITPFVLSPNFFVPIPNVLLIGSTLIVGSMAFIGWSALRRTPMDGVFCLWAFLAMVSHVWALSYLNRNLPEFSLYIYIFFIMTAWIAFRAGYAVMRITPTFGPIALVVAIIFTLAASAILGILQGVGPVQQAAIEFGARFSGSEAKVLEGAAGGRPTGVFGGPNLLGYANDVAAMCLAAIGAAYARTAKPYQVALIMAGLGVFGYSTLLCQSRTSLAIFVIILLGYGLSLRRLGPPRSFAVYVLLLFGVGGVGAIAFQTSKLEYVAGTFQNSLTKDSSFVIRQQALQQVANIAVDVAPLGSGTSQVNQTSLVTSRGYEPYWTFGVDNEWINIYLAHGVWGPVMIAIFYLVGFRGSIRALRSSTRGGRLVGAVATGVLILNFVFGLAGVRVAKYETAIYASALLGASFAFSNDRPPLRRPAPPAKAA